MGNTQARMRARGSRKPGTTAKQHQGWHQGWHPPRRDHVLPAEGDVVYPVNDVLEVSEGALDQLRQLIDNDPEAFLLDNLLMSTQYFENYEEEARAARTAGPRSQSRKLDGLTAVAAAHVQCRVGRAEPDQRLAAARRLVVSDNITVLAGGASSPAGLRRPALARGVHHHLITEPGVKPGFVKLRRVSRASDGTLSTLEEEEETVEAAPWGSWVGSSRPRPRTPKTPSPLASPPQLRASRPRPQESMTDSAISSDESLSWPSDGSFGKNEHEKRVPLNEFRARTTGYLRGSSPRSVHDLSKDCFQAVQTLRAAKADPDVDDEESPAPQELHSVWYLMAHPFVVRFAHAFHDSLGDALGVPTESLHQASLRLNNGPAAVLYERTVGGHALLTLQHEVVPALPLDPWAARAALREWVVRKRTGGWPASRTVRAVHDLVDLGVAVPVVPHGSDAHTLQWALAFPEAERLLELSMSAPQAHAYLSLVAVLRAVPGVNANLVRAFFLRLSERMQADIPSAASSLGWAPGRSLRRALHYLYEFLKQRHLPDYFVAERNLMSELSKSQIYRAQERLLRVREQLVYRVLQTCRRLVYVREDDFYPRLQYDKLVALLAEPDSSQSSPSSRYATPLTTPSVSRYTTPNGSRYTTPSNSRKTSRNETFGGQNVFNTNWVESFNVPGEASGPSRSRKTSRAEQQRERERSHIPESSVNQKWIDEVRRRTQQERSRETEAAWAFTNNPRLQKHMAIKLGTSSLEARERTQGLLKLFCDQFIRMGEVSIQFKDNSQAYVYLRHSLHLLTILQLDYGHIHDARQLLSRVRQAERALTQSSMTNQNLRKAVHANYSNPSPHNAQRQQNTMFGSTFVF